MRKYCITADTDVSYNIYDNLIIIGKTKINKKNCKSISFVGDKIILEVESSKTKSKKNKLQVPKLWYI